MADIVCHGCSAMLKLKQGGIGCEFVVPDKQPGVPASPYYKAFGDLYECPNCMVRVIAGWGGKIWHHDHGYEKVPTTEVIIL